MVALDTSGVVYIPCGDHAGDWAWRHLSPFEQGYVIELFRQEDTSESLRWDCPSEEGVERTPLGFQHLAYETLAAIREDCARFCVCGFVGCRTREGGASFWARRTEWWHGFPPLTVSLGDDGKVRFQ